MAESLSIQQLLFREYFAIIFSLVLYKGNELCYSSTIIFVQLHPQIQSYVIPFFVIGFRNNVSTEYSLVEISENWKKIQINTGFVYCTKLRGYYWECKNAFLIANFYPEKFDINVQNLKNIFSCFINFVWDLNYFSFLYIRFWIIDLIYCLKYWFNNFRDNSSIFLRWLFKVYFWSKNWTI